MASQMWMNQSKGRDQKYLCFQFFFSTNPPMRRHGCGWTHWVWGQVCRKWPKGGFVRNPAQRIAERRARPAAIRIFGSADVWNASLWVPRQLKTKNQQPMFAPWRGFAFAASCVQDGSKHPGAPKKCSAAWLHPWNLIAVHAVASWSTPPGSECWTWEMAATRTSAQHRLGKSLSMTSSVRTWCGWRGWKFLPTTVSLHHLILCVAILHFLTEILMCQQLCPISTDICFPCFPNASMLPQLSALVCDVTSAPFFHFFALAGGRVSASESGRAAKSRSRPAITLGDWQELGCRRSMNPKN